MQREQKKKLKKYLGQGDFMIVKVVNKSDMNLPEYETSGASGIDLRANVAEPIVMKQFERALVPTGLFMEIPKGYEGQIRGRSGLALKNGVMPANGIGTIDSDYRGEIKVILINLGKEDFIINKGDRVAQFVLIKYDTIQFEKVDEVEETKRGEGGFGHTGL